MRSYQAVPVYAVIAVASLLGACAVPSPVATTTSTTCDTKRLDPGAGSGVVFDVIRDDLIYPRESCLARREGTVVARFTLLRNGQVEDVEIEKSSGDPLMDKEVVRALRDLKARGKTMAWPAGVASSAPKAIGHVTVNFKLGR
jgi:TonB family protein